MKHDWLFAKWSTIASTQKRKRIIYFTLALGSALTVVLIGSENVIMVSLFRGLLIGAIIGYIISWREWKKNAKETETSLR